MKNIAFLFIFAALFAQEISSPPLTIEPLPILPPKKDPYMATLLSSVFPGLGHFYLNDPQTAGSLMGTASMELGILIASAMEGRKGMAMVSAITYANTLSYGVYAAYRDARVINGPGGYHYKMPTDQLADLTAAPFRWSVLKKPEVWGGLLGALAIAGTVSYFAFPSEARISTIRTEKIGPWFPALALPVGIGEEAVFRGVVQPRFAESLGPWGAIAASSLLFGAAHIPNAQLLPEEEQWRYYTFSLPLITTMGVYLGWLAQKNISLKECVALHTWYDFTLFGLAALAQSAAIGCPGFSYAIPF